MLPQRDPLVYLRCFFLNEILTNKLKVIEHVHTSNCFKNAMNGPHFIDNAILIEKIMKELHFSKLFWILSNRFDQVINYTGIRRLSTSVK